MTSVSGYSDDASPDALALAIGGDEVAFARIVAEHHARLIKVCVVICGDRDLAEDAVAAAWVHAWRNLASVRDRHRLRGWLVSIAANEARQVMRTTRRRGIREIAIDPALTEARPDPAARVVDLDLVAALRTLSPDDRTLLALRYVAGFDSTEIGRVTGRSASGTRVRLARLLERLRKELRDA